MSFNLMMEEMIQKFKWLGKKLGASRSHCERVRLTNNARVGIVDDDEVAAAGTSPVNNTVDDTAALVTATTTT